MTKEAREPRTRGHKKKERTRRHLIAAGLRVLGEKGQGLTVSDVVAEAEVSNGTFYNYFADRDELLEELAEHSVLSLARPGSGVDMSRYLREDLEEGFALGRFDVGPDAATLDQIAGLVIMTIRRIVEGQATHDTPEQAVRRGLCALGVDDTESARLAIEAATHSTSADRETAPNR
jgi:AcrR family transcriptional regulator